MKIRPVILLSIGVLLGLSGVLAARSYLTRNQFQGSLIDPPVQATDFQLTDQSGHSFRLSDQRGKVVLMFFGYTHCPDICPATLAEFQQIKAALGSRADQVRFVLITVDPENDTPQQMAAYMNRFDPTFTGLTGTRAELELVWKAYGVYQQQNNAATPTPDQIEHSTYVYAIDRQGNLRLTYAFGFTSDAITSDLLNLLRQ